MPAAPRNNIVQIQKDFKREPGKHVGTDYIYTRNEPRDTGHKREAMKKVGTDYIYTRDAPRKEVEDESA